MKIKSLSLVFISILFSSISIQSMDNPTAALQLAKNNKVARINILKKTWLSVFEHVNVSSQARQNILRYFPLFNYLKRQEIIMMSTRLRGILEIPHNLFGHIRIIRNMLRKLPKRKAAHERFKKSPLKYQCLYKLKNISLITFYSLCHDLQLELTEMHGRKRIDLVYAYAKKRLITLKLARMIVAKINIKHTNLHRSEAEFNRIFPKEILNYGNNKMLAYVLMNSNR